MCVYEFVVDGGVLVTQLVTLSSAADCVYIGAAAAIFAYDANVDADDDTDLTNLVVANCSLLSSVDRVAV